MRILVTGSSGQLGTALRAVLERRHEVLWTDMDDLDVRDLSAVREAVASFKPEAILHLAAVTNVDECELRPQLGFEVNSLGTRYVALAAREAGAEMLFVSTDYVFDGLSSEPYLEYDPRRPINQYGRSKVHGERVVETLLDRFYIVRTSGLFGQGGRNFVGAILNGLKSGRSLKVVDDQFCRPTYAPHLAAAIGRIVGSGYHGIYHVASAGETSWFGFAVEVAKAAGLDSGALQPIVSKQLDRPARRPPYSVLDTRAFEVTFGWAIPPWKEGLVECLSSL